jgi:hypothetical protein
VKPPNNILDQTACLHPLAAAGQTCALGAGGA